MPKDNHRKHQQLMQKLDIINARILGHEIHMSKVRRTLPSEKWEDLVRQLKVLKGKKEALYREIRSL